MEQQMIKAIAFSALSLSGVTLATSEFDAPPFVQYGALGLAFMVVYFLCMFLRDTLKIHKEERKELVDSLREDIEKRDKIVAENTAAFNRLSIVLQNKPCLKDADKNPS